LKNGCANVEIVLFRVLKIHEFQRKPTKRVLQCKEYDQAGIGKRAKGKDKNSIQGTNGGQ
jgi:hypothetical protein